MPLFCTTVASGPETPLMTATQSTPFSSVNPLKRSALTRFVCLSPCQYRTYRQVKIESYVSNFFRCLRTWYNSSTVAYTSVVNFKPYIGP